MQNEQTAQAAAADLDAPALLTPDQAALVAGGLMVIGSTGVKTGICCLTCASYGRPLFSAVAAAT